MIIEIWSDIMCPFCYIGKSHFDHAMQKIDFAKELQVIYRSYQLSPDHQYVEGQTIYSYLEQSKGISQAQARQMTQQVAQMGKETGLDIDFDSNIPANTFKAHKLIHFAQKYGKASLFKQRLFSAHFTQGLNIQDDKVLLNLAAELSLPMEETSEALQSDQYGYLVRQDIQEAGNIGIKGVPFFLFNRKYAVSGAQPVASFVEVLQKSYAEFKQDNAGTQIIHGKPGAPGCSEEGCEI